MTEITTLTQFLTQSNSQFQVYEMGRRVQQITLLDFEQIENLTQPYPSPIQGHAHFAILFWNESEQHFIWFLKLPLDERGLLSPAPRTQFIKMVVEALGQDLTQPISQQQQDKLNNHPFAFKPSIEKLAVFNALVRYQLGQPVSNQYEFVQQYLSGEEVSERWQEVGLQGLADLCTRFDQLDHLELLINTISTSTNTITSEVKIALCQLLEHIALPKRLSTALFHQFLQTTPPLKHYYLRALASDNSLSQQAIATLDKQNMLNEETLIIIAARNYMALIDEATRTCYLESLAKQPQTFFNQIFADLVAIPAIRVHLLASLRTPKRSEQLATAIGGLFKTTKAKANK